MKGTAEIDKELEKWKRKTTELQEQLAEADANLSKVEEDRNGLLVSALAEDNAKAKGKVEGLTEAWLRAMRRKGDLEITLKQLGQKISDLQTEREEAHKEEVRQKKRAAFDELIEYAKQNPEPLAAWVETCKRFKAFTELIAACDAELGESKIISDNLPVRYYQSLFFTVFEGIVSKPHGVYLGKTFLQFLEERRRRFIGEEPEAQEEEGSEKEGSVDERIQGL